jgi:hypothetical protein
VLTPTLPGAYQYFVNKALPVLGEFRTLWVLDNRTFTHGVTLERNERLPPLSDVRGGTKTGDETFQKSDGSFVTKYDFTAFLGNVEGDLTYWGLSGSVGATKVGSWYIHGGKVYKFERAGKRCSLLKFSIGLSERRSLEARANGPPREHFWRFRLAQYDSWNAFSSI